MSRHVKFIEKKIPLTINTHCTFFSGVLSCGDDFETSDDIFEAIGEILAEIAEDKSENDIRELCDKFLTILRTDGDAKSSDSKKVLDAPVQLGLMAANLSENDIDNMTSIWIQSRAVELVSWLDSFM